jgi:transcriptional regulator with XRE-family HTH domain
MVNYKAIGRRINFYRKQLSITQAEFAEKLGVSESYVSQIERGTAKVSLVRLDQIADILEVNICFLISDKVITSDESFNSEISEIIKNWSPERISLLVDLLMCANENFENQ